MFGTYDFSFSSKVVEAVVCGDGVSLETGEDVCVVLLVSVDGCPVD